MINNKKHFLLLILVAIFPICLNAQKNNSANLNIVFIGNSITQGVLLEHPKQEAPPVQTSIWLSGQNGIGKVNIANTGVSGTTTVDYLPASKSYFPKVKEATQQLMNTHPEATLLFSIMLGTNDSAIKGPNGSPISAPQYYTNIKVIVDELLSSFPKAIFVLHRPIWYSPNTYNGAMYLKEGLTRLESYFPQIQSFIKDYSAQYPNQFFVGDTEAFDYFKANYKTEFVPENGNAGTFFLHPNEKGANTLGTFWGKAIYKVIFE